MRVRHAREEGSADQMGHSVLFGEATDLRDALLRPADDEPVGHQPVQIGRDALTYWSQALKTFMRARDQLPASRVCDLRYNDVRRDPIAAVRRVYEHFRWPFAKEIEERMRVVLTQQASQTNGVHRYDATHFKLDEMNGFAEYCEQFGFSSSSTNRQEERAEAAA